MLDHEDRMLLKALISDLQMEWKAAQFQEQYALFYGKQNQLHRIYM